MTKITLLNLYYPTEDQLYVYYLKILLFYLQQEKVYNLKNHDE